jgi:hypothetical protein
MMSGMDGKAPKGWTRGDRKQQSGRGIEGHGLRIIVFKNHAHSNFFVAQVG